MEPTSEFIDAAAWVGRQQAFAVIASKASAAQAQCLKQVKGDRLFEKLGITWEEFCLSHVGLSRQSADRLIQQYEEFGEAYFKLSELARISPQTFRQIADSVDDETITMNGEEIALVPENAPRIRAGLDALRSQACVKRGGAPSPLSWNCGCAPMRCSTKPCAGSARPCRPSSATRSRTWRRKPPAAGPASRPRSKSSTPPRQTTRV